MRYQISNRVFWAAVVLAGCAILSSRSRSQGDLGELAVPLPLPPPKPAFVDTLRVHRLEIIDSKDNPRIIQTVDPDQRASLYFLAAQDAAQGDHKGTYSTLYLSSQPCKPSKGEDPSKPCEDARLDLEGYRGGENSGGSDVILRAEAESHIEMITGHRGYRSVFLQPSKDGALLQTFPPEKWNGK